MTDLTKKLSPQEDFQNKIKERIQSQIGELIPAEVLQEMVKRGIDDAFFAPRTQTEYVGYTQRQVAKEPWFVEYLQNTLDQQVKEALDRWMAENPETVQKLIQDTMSEGIEKAVIKGFYGIIQTSMFELEGRVNQYISSRLH